MIPTFLQGVFSSESRSRMSYYVEDNISGRIIISCQDWMIGGTGKRAAIHLRSTRFTPAHTAPTPLPPGTEELTLFESFWHLK